MAAPVLRSLPRVPIYGIPTNIDTAPPNPAHVGAIAIALNNLTPVERVDMMHRILWRHPLLAAQIIIRLDEMRRADLRRQSRDRADERRAVQRAISLRRPVAVDEDGIVRPTWYA